MSIDIKKVIEGLKADAKANATFVNDVRIKDVSIYLSKNENVDYWCTISLDTAIRGVYSIKVGDTVEYRKGLVTTITTPIGTFVSLLFNALLDIDSKDRVDLGGGVTKSLSYVAKKLAALKDVIVDDAEHEATIEGYTSHLHELLIGASINVITRDVYKEDGKVKSLFSLNERELDILNDSVWHDVYGLTGLDDDFIVDAYQFAIKANEKKAADDANGNTATTNAVLAALQKQFSGNAGIVNAALG